jgi:hypothetical protein
MRRGQRYISVNGNGGKPRDDDPRTKRDQPLTRPVEQERIGSILDRVLEEHRETIEKLGNE